MTDLAAVHKFSSVPTLEARPTRRECFWRGSKATRILYWLIPPRTILLTHRLEKVPLGVVMPLFREVRKGLDSALSVLDQVIWSSV